MKTAIQKFNALNGKTVTRKELLEIKELATSPDQKEVVKRIDELLQSHPKKWFSMKADTFQIQLKSKVKSSTPGGNKQNAVVDQNAKKGDTGERGLGAGLDELHGLECFNLLDFHPGQSSLDPIGLAKAVSSDDIYQTITDSIVKMLEKEIDWEKEWNPGQNGFLYAYNFDTKKPYRGINSIMLGSKYIFDPSEPLLENPYYLTFNQITKRNGKVKKRAKAHLAIYFTKLYHYQQGEPALEFGTYDRKKMIAFLNKNRSKISLFKKLTAEQIADQSYLPVLKYYNVFNGADIEGVDFDLDNFKGAGQLKSGKQEKPEKLEISEAIINSYPKPSPTLKYGGNRAFFRPSSDLVQMPNIEQFKYVQAYYTTFFHELIHSTGSKKRLDRVMGKSSVTRTTPLKN